MEAAGQAVRRDGAGGRSLRRHDALTAWLFILPTLIGFLAFVVGPVLGGLALGFMRYDLLTPPSFVGGENFVKMIEDQRILQIFGNTVYYVVGHDCP